MMNTEKEGSNPSDKKIHQTHFPVVKIPLPDTDRDSGYEWVRSGTCRWKRVPKKTEDDTHDDGTT